MNVYNDIKENHNLFQAIRQMLSLNVYNVIKENYNSFQVIC